MNSLPVFQSRFLSHVCRRLEARRKAIRYHGGLSWETKQPDDFEWLTVTLEALVGNYCIFQFVEDNRVGVHIRSKKQRNRGKVLLAIEDITVVDDPIGIVSAIERTVDLSGALDSEDPSPALDAIRAIWSVVEVRGNRSHPGEQ